MTAQSSFFADSGFSKSRKRIPPVEAVCSIARRLWPSKTAINLASRAEISERAAKLWLEGRTEPGADALVNLLRSDAGFDLLQEIMAGSGTRWWKEFRRGVHIAELEAKQEFLRKQLDALKEEM
ncbi:hypothetical protein [Rhizobium lentis]|uniref:hypothetical protein n=1 Tax=Rhizobium lentis TaxID=1138194 RepID=UPI002180D491|nr:hypothetical protein [Rhizobium lentis]